MVNIATLAYDEAPEETFSDFFLIVFYRPNDKIYETQRCWFYDKRKPNLSVRSLSLLFCYLVPFAMLFYMCKCILSCLSHVVPESIVDASAQTEHISTRSHPPPIPTSMMGPSFYMQRCSNSGNRFMRMRQILKMSTPPPPSSSDGW